MMYACCNASVFRQIKHDYMKHSFSREYLFNKCVGERKCMCFLLRRPVAVDNNLHHEIFVLDIASEDKEKQEEFILNIANGNNTYGELEVSYFVNHGVPYKENIHRTKINTCDIIQVEFVE